MITAGKACDVFYHSLEALQIWAGLGAIPVVGSSDRQWLTTFSSSSDSYSAKYKSAWLSEALVFRIVLGIRVLAL